ncbi:hypothetical protein ANANG_G00070510 [Anguilla anguilla]|uniref:Uncharacterized protein n=1 Tax=Anguilla anguilla TaxID=7936 RepID=A0A9D3S7T9_ANGAN|nr:hypothetical protein ANANG_G00070510 [Anguilla anguilla]
MDPSEVTPSDDMSVMVGVAVASLAVAAASLWVLYRRRVGNGRPAGTREGKGRKDELSPEQSPGTPLADEDAKQEEEGEEEDVEEESFS